MFACVAAAFAALLIMSGCGEAEPEPPAETLPVTLGVSRESLSALAYVARDHGIFEANGLDVAFIEYPSSQIAYEMLVTGEVETALCADTPIVIGALSGSRIEIIATASTDANDIKVVARSDAGVEEAGDLEGKRIGTQQGTAAHFFLHSFLIKNGMSEDDVDVRFDSFAAITQALLAGELDAVALRQPFIGQLHDALGERFVLFEEHGLYGKTMNLCVTPGDNLDPEVKERLVRSFIDAEQQAISVPMEQTNAEVAEALRVHPTELCDCMFVEGAVGLRQSLILTLEDQARWVKDSGLVAEPVEFDSLSLLDPGPLDAADANRVTILR
ncbi:MAG: NrtA/SsuA/CpmA family ABC transporter substrate-binding protein [Coriobacteriia bacterium]|nr:NrtA/SsuA/CpmA family ABC transporter substrate-binding protein [Coriobacteriia bacterium]